VSPTRPAVKLASDRCDQCGRCVTACKPRALKLGPGYIYIDSARCDGCLGCADICDRGAITRRDRPPQSAPVLRRKATEEGTTARPRAKATPPATPVPAPPAKPAVSSAWTSFDAGVSLVVLLGGLVLVALVMRSDLVRIMPPSGKVLVRVAAMSLAYGSEFLVLVALARRHGLRLGTAFGLVPLARSVKSALTSTLLVVGLLVSARLFATGYALVTQSFSWAPSVDWGRDLTRVFGPDLTGFALTVVLAVAVGPFVEELVFRGVVLSALRKRWSLAISITISAALFAVCHFSLWMFAPIFVLGVALGWLAGRSQGLWPAIWLHVLYNGVTVAAAFWLVWR
jgi:membrane protease YdiL (CAAX protease family)/NAD-dependent dihydropyrimidine dehydrogenase PreA subunit